ncbi:MAG TPA: hypothetical protein DCL35_03365 [Candidatus Omnitrophica bacterium]|nr:hypothetical protein [Candidatus Omnitrophota bacterium]
MMRHFKNIAALFFYVVFLSGIFVPASYAITLMTQDEALHYVFADASDVVEEKYELDAATLAAVQDRLGGVWVNHEEKGYRILPPKEITFYFSVKDGKKTDAAVILEEPGKWGPIQFIVALDPAGAVANVAVLRYKETRGRPVARNTFLSQFFGKTGKDNIRVHEDITGISGATFSSKAAAFCVRKAIVLYEETVLKKANVS